MWLSNCLRQPISRICLGIGWREGSSTKGLNPVGVCALFWTIGNCHDDIVFNKIRVSNYWHVIHKDAHWIHTWCLLQRAEAQECLWVKPLGDGRTGYVHPIWMAV